MTTAIERLAERLLAQGEDLAAAASGRALVPMAVDRPGGDFAAILLAERAGEGDGDSRARWRARAAVVRRFAGAWREFGDDEVSWEGDPRVRPREGYGEQAWNVPGSWFAVEGGPAAMAVFGAAPADAAVLRVVAGDAAPRAVRPVAETGAYVVVLRSPDWSVDVLAADGTLLDRLAA